ncbi:cutinase family protein, partial [Lactococcus hodotermopsidis]|uniref:cutinase family protein n=1 Tax=Pseudolactococcus hodotermopsidis TaxID=2709157 RepID=UPI00280B83F2
IGFSTLNDWIDNDAVFALTGAYIPQAKLANEAMQVKVDEMAVEAPNAQMNVTGHSLGTMVSIQAVANLPEEDISKIGNVVLFNGPDSRSSIDKMGEQAKANIEKLEADGKIHYYVNAFDIVSMLNRNQEGVDEIGVVHYILPTNLAYTSTFYMKNSSHDFGMYDFDSDGNIKEATIEKNPEIFEAGIKLSKLIRETIDRLKTIYGLSETDAMRILTSASALPPQYTTSLYAGVAGAFLYNYNKIIKDAESVRNIEERIESLHSSIKSSSGAEKIALRSDLALEVSQKAKNLGEEYELIVKNELSEIEDEIDTLVQDVEQGAYEIMQYLPSWEVEGLIQELKKDVLWDNDLESDIKKEAKAYKDKLTDFSDTLYTVSLGIQEYDTQAGGELFKNELIVQGKVK